METFITDLKFAIRVLWRDRMFTLTCLLTLILCIGGNVAIFSGLHAILLQKPPYPEPDRLVGLYTQMPRWGYEYNTIGTADYALRRQAESFEETALYTYQSLNFTSGNTTDRVVGLRVSSTLLSTLGIEPFLGRNFTPDDNHEGAERVAIVSYGFWQEHFGGDPGAIGNEFRMNSETYSLIGVLPEGFVFQGQYIRVWIPFTFEAGWDSEENLFNHSYRSIGRLKEGVTVDAAQNELDRLTHELTLRDENARQFVERTGWNSQVDSFDAVQTRWLRPRIMTLQIAVLFVLIIGCVNIANLMMSRAIKRQREWGIRLSLGASRLALARQVVTESLVLSILGGTLALIFAQGAIGGLNAMIEGSLPYGRELSLNFPALLFALGSALFAGILCGLVPLPFLFRKELSDSVHNESRSVTEGKASGGLRSFLAVAQIALACTLLIGSGLLIQSFNNLLKVDPGFNQDQVLLARYTLPGKNYPSIPEKLAYADRLIREIENLPGVQHVGVASSVPFSGSNSSSTVTVEGYTPSEEEEQPLINRINLHRDFLQAMGIPLIEGRFFRPEDFQEDAPRTIIIDQQVAKRFWPEASPVGKRIAWGTHEGDLSEVEWFTVVGVVGNIKHNSLRDEVRHGRSYHPVAWNMTGMQIIVKAAGSPEALFDSMRKVALDVDPEVPLYHTRTMRSAIDNSLQSTRQPMVLLIGFSATALILSALGIYGVLAYQVLQRTREFGIRIALGAQDGNILGQVLRRGVLLTLIGLALGLALAAGLTRLMNAMLFEVAPFDLNVYLIVAGSLTTIALLACCIPALRATRINPVEALRQE